MFSIIVGIFMMTIGAILPGNIEDPGLIDFLKAGSFLIGFVVSVKGFKNI